MCMYMCVCPELGKDFRFIPGEFERLAMEESEKDRFVYFPLVIEFFFFFFRGFTNAHGEDC